MCRKRMKEALILSVKFFLKYRSRRKKIKQNLVIPKYQYIQYKPLTILIKGKGKAIQIINARNERRDITTDLTEIESMRGNSIFNKVNNPARCGSECL